jgi:hypothetical protein
MGIAGTLLVHMLALQSVLLGSRAPKVRPPDVQESGAALAKTATKPAETLVLIELPKVKTNQDFLEELASAAMSQWGTSITTIRPDPLPRIEIESLAIEDEKNAAAPVDSGDGADRAQLLGIYSRQIQARVERAWRRPRSAVNDASVPSMVRSAQEYFRCQVQIVQDATGNVQEILLPNCNGSLAWQRSLVLAIQQSSPLPAPPSPTVFSHAVSLTFVGYAYVAGSSEEDYESAPPRTAQAH